MNATTLSSRFTPAWQEAIVGHMLDGRSFFIKCEDLLENTWFQDATVGAIFKTMVEFYRQYKRCPTRHEIEQDIFVKQGGISTALAPYSKKIDSCILYSKNIGLDKIAPDMTLWIKTIKFKEAIVKSTGMFNKDRYDQAIDLVSTELKAIAQASFEEAQSVKFLDVDEFLEQRNIEFVDCLTIGHPEFDVLFREGAAKNGDINGYKTISDDKDGLKAMAHTNGGLVKGDSTIIIGAANSGKTSTLITVIASNIIAGKRTLYITHEQKWEDIKSKLFCCLLGMNSIDIAATDEKTKSDRAKWAGYLDRFLTYVPWIKTGQMYVEDVIAAIIQYQETLKSMPGRNGAGYDLLVVDYPAKTKSRSFKGGKSSVWEDVDFVYDQYVNLCLEHRFHGIFPAQTNREGYKISRGTSDDRLVDMGDIGGSFGIVQKADNVITINRFNIADNKSVIVYNMVKSRSNSTGRRFASMTDLAFSRTHGFNLDNHVFPATTPVNEDALRKHFLASEANIKATLEAERGFSAAIDQKNLPETAATNPINLIDEKKDQAN